MQPWREVEVAGALSSGEVRSAQVAGTSERVLLVRDLSGVLHATGIVCPHLGQPLSDAEVEGGLLVCAHHRYGFDLRLGTCVVPSGGGLAGALPVHEVHEDGGRVEVRLAETPTSAPVGPPSP